MALLSHFLRYSGLGILLAVLAAGPFFQGLFFWADLLAAIALVAAGFLLWLIGVNLGGLSPGLPGGIAGIALLALTGAYLLQFAWAAFPRGNLDWLLRAATAWFAYVMFRAEAGPTLRRWLALIFALSAGTVGLLGFLEYSGYLTLDPSLLKALGVVALNERMPTFFEYPNAGAIYFLAALLMVAGFAAISEKPWYTALAGGLCTFWALAIFFTVSRGALVAVPVGLILLLVGLARQQRLTALLLLLGSTAAALLAVKGIGANAAIGNYVSAFRWIVAATVAGAIGGLALTHIRRLRPKIQLAFIGLALVAGGTVLAVLRPSGASLPVQAARLLELNLDSPSIALRLHSTYDALRMFADAPLGRGGWGWDRTYRRYQRFAYISREVHNHYAQVAVEAGVPGLVALLTAAGAAMWAGWQARRVDPTTWTLASAAGTILAHSLIDFDLSFGLHWLLTWGLLAAAANPLSVSIPVPVSVPVPVARHQRHSLLWTGALVMGVAVTAMAASLWVGMRYTLQAEELAAQERTEEAAQAVEKAARYDPWNSSPLLLLNDRLSLERAARLDPHNGFINGKLALALELRRDWDGALKEAQKAIATQPMTAAHYDRAAGLIGLLLEQAMHGGNKAEALRLATDLTILGDRFLAVQAQQEAYQQIWPRPPMEMEPAFRLRYGQALFLTGKKEIAETYLKEAAQVGLLGSQAHVWLYVLYESRSDTAAMAELQSRPWIRFRHANPVYQMLREWK